MDTASIFTNLLLWTPTAWWTWQAHCWDLPAWAWLLGALFMFFIVGPLFGLLVMLVLVLLGIPFPY